MSEPPILELRGAAVGYDRRAVLSDLTFSAARGALIGVLGANGSGKTTLLKTIAGILPLVRGEMSFHGSAALGYVPQRDQLDPVYILSAFEVALMGVCGRLGPLRRVSSAERDRVHACLEQTGANTVAKKQFSELSGGQKQRVLIARALAADADFLLLDEPTAGIDAAATRSIMELLVTLNRERKLTVLMVNHDLAAMRQSVTEIIWIRDGKLVRGPVQELLRRETIEELLQLQFA